MIEPARPVGTRTLTLEIHPQSNPIAGRLSEGGTSGHQFVGWLGLARALELALQSGDVSSLDAVGLDPASTTAPAEDAPAEDAPAGGAPAGGAPAEDAPAEDAPAEDAPA